MRSVLGLALVVGGGWLMYRVIEGTSGAQFTPTQLQTVNKLACQTGISWLCPPNTSNTSTTSNPPGPVKSKFGPIPQ